MKFSCEVIEEIGELRNVFQSNQTLEYIKFGQATYMLTIIFGNISNLATEHWLNYWLTMITILFFSYLYIETSKVEENADQLSLNANV